MTSRIDNFPPLLIVGHRYAGSSRYHIIEEREDIQGGRVPGRCENCFWATEGGR